MDSSTQKDNNLDTMKERVAGTATKETPPFNDEHPLGTGQQCFICGAYNDVEATACWHCSTELTHSMVETPGITDNVLPTETDER